MAYNASKKLNDNINAIRVALEFAKGKPVDLEGVSMLQRYSGFGGIKPILFQFADKESWTTNKATKADFLLLPKIKELHDLLRDNLNGNEYKAAIDSIKNSVLTAFYT